MDIKYWFTRKVESIQIAIAWALPKSILKWALVKCAVSVKTEECPGNVTYEQMYKAI